MRGMGTGDKVDKPAGRGAMCRERAQEGMDTQQRGRWAVGRSATKAGWTKPDGREGSGQGERARGGEGGGAV